MESDGMRVDVPYLQEQASIYGVKVMEGWNRVVALTGRPDLNPNAPAQVMEALNARGLYPEDTQAGTLEKLDDEFVRALLEYRGDKKLHQTYLVGLLHAQRDGIFHPNFNDDGARTGRMSSGAAKE
jgi:DNA polymerase-1